MLFVYSLCEFLLSLPETLQTYNLQGHPQLSVNFKPTTEQRGETFDWRNHTDDSPIRDWLALFFWKSLWTSLTHPLTINFSILKLDNEAAKQTHFNRQTFWRLSFCQGPRYRSTSNITKRGWNNHRLKLNRSFNLSLEGHSSQTLLSCGCLLLPTC